MPALATRFTGGTAQSPNGPRETRPAAAVHLEPVSARLSDEFLDVPFETVDRCVEDVRACAAHLGVEVTSSAVERIAREHLLALASSAPLLGRTG